MFVDHHGHLARASRAFEDQSSVACPDRWNRTDYSGDRTAPLEFSSRSNPSVPHAGELVVAVLTGSACTAACVPCRHGVGIGADWQFRQPHPRGHHLSRRQLRTRTFTQDLPDPHEHAARLLSVRLAPAPPSSRCVVRSPASVPMIRSSSCRAHSAQHQRIADRWMTQSRRDPQHGALGALPGDLPVPISPKRVGVRQHRHPRCAAVMASI